MKKLLEAWSLGRIRDALSIADKLVKSGKTFEDVRNWLEQSRQSNVQQNIPIKKCPECGKSMRLYPVNTNTEDQVGGGYNLMWLCGTTCSGKGCLYEEYSTKTINEELELINGILY